MFILNESYTDYFVFAVFKGYIDEDNGDDDDVFYQMENTFACREHHRWVSLEHKQNRMIQYTYKMCQIQIGSVSAIVIG